MFSRLLNQVVHFNVELKKRPQSWASTPDIDDENDQAKARSRTAALTPVENNVDFTVKLPIPPRRHTTTLDLKEVSMLKEKTV